jgi:cytoplasmic iron level regulating protein YaaA (DUF328/UPF0246 family)
MIVIVSPAKKMKVNLDSFPVEALPSMIEETKQVMKWMKALPLSEAKELWQCNDKLAELNFKRFQEMDLETNLTPAILAYEGIQYQYMAPQVFTDEALDYIKNHLRILSGFYGVLSPFDGVVPYRLEMQAKAKVRRSKDLYDFWKDKIYKNLVKKDRVILNLASKEYSKCVEAYLSPKDCFITCVFGELSKGKVIQKGTIAKMARGEMVRFLAENQIDNPEDVKRFSELSYEYNKELSSDKEYVFIRKCGN